MSAQLDTREVDAMLRALTRVLEGIDDKKTRREIMDKAAAPVVAAAQGIVKARASGEKPRKRYLSNGDHVATYYPGNLRRSIERLKHLKRAIAIIIGPRIPKNPYGDFKGKKTDGYYAQIVYNSAKNFGREVMQTALNQSQNTALGIAEREINRLVPKLARKHGFAQ